MEGTPRKAEEVRITLYYEEGDKHLSENDIKVTLDKMIAILNCRKDIAILERRDKPGKKGIFVKTYPT